MTISFYAVFQFVTSSDRVWTFISPYKHRASGTYISPNHLAGLLDMILPLALCWMLVSRTKILTKVFIGYAALAIAGGLAVTLSRGGWAATTLTLVVFFGVLLSNRMYRVPSIVLLVFLTLAAAYFVPRAHFSAPSRTEKPLCQAIRWSSWYRITCQTCGAASRNSQRSFFLSDARTNSHNTSPDAGISIQNDDMVSTTEFYPTAARDRQGEATAEHQWRVLPAST